jgi:hypothetical protein
VTINAIILPVGLLTLLPLLLLVPQFHLRLAADSDFWGDNDGKQRYGAVRNKGLLFLLATFHGRIG